MPSIPIFPTVGRTVHFFKRVADQYEGPFAATITRVHDETCVDLFVMEPFKASHMARAPLYGSAKEYDQSEATHDVWCAWPPYFETLATGDEKEAVESTQGSDPSA